MPESSGAGEGLARNFGPAPFRVALVVVALGYLSLLIADHARTRGLRSLVPGPIVFFAQIADLFPQASAGIIEYRAEGWLCGERRFAEIDMGKLFPMLAGNKENRFYRLMHFYRENGTVLGALDDYCVRRYPSIPTGAGPDRIGGVRFTSLILPLPKHRPKSCATPANPYPRTRTYRGIFGIPLRAGSPSARCADADGQALPP